MIDEKLIRVEDKLDNMLEKIGKIDILLTSHNEILKNSVEKIHNMEQELKPIQKHVILVQGILKLVLSLSAIAGTIACILEAVK